MSTAKDAAPRDRPLAAAVGTVHRHRGLRPVAVRCTLLASALALAPSVTPAAEEATEATPTAVRELLPDGTVVRVLGRDVKGPSGQVVAQVVNVLVDGSGRPLAAILDYGGFMGVGKRRVAVAWRALSFTPGGTPGGSGITLALTRDQLKGFPDHKDGEPIVVAGPPPAPSGAPDLAPTDEPAPAAIPK